MIVSLITITFYLVATPSQMRQIQEIMYRTEEMFMANMEREPILSARDVEISFSLRGKKLNAIRRCSLDLYQGETLAIVGESGSGKSVFTKSFLGMLDANGSITGGSILFEGRIWQV